MTTNTAVAVSSLSSNWDAKSSEALQSSLERDVELSALLEHFTNESVSKLRHEDRIPREENGRTAETGFRELKPVSTFPASLAEINKQAKKSVAPSFIVLQEWEGYVTDIQAQEFSARLTDVTNGGSTESEEAQLPIADLSEESKKQLRLGALFRWTIGYLVGPRQPRSRASTIVFRELPRWTKNELIDARSRGAERAASIKTE